EDSARQKLAPSTSRSGSTPRLERSERMDEGVHDPAGARRTGWLEIPGSLTVGYCPPCLNGPSWGEDLRGKKSHLQRDRTAGPWGGISGTDQTPARRGQRSSLAGPHRAGPTGGEGGRPRDTNPSQGFYLLRAWPCGGHRGDVAHP